MFGSPLIGGAPRPRHDAHPTPLLRLFVTRVLVAELGCNDVGRFLKANMLVGAVRVLFVVRVVDKSLTAMFFFFFRSFAAP